MRLFLPPPVHQWFKHSKHNVAVCVFCLLLFAFEFFFTTPAAQVGFSAFSLQPSQVNQGAWWQLITAHFLHFTPHHLFWNIAALMILTLAFEAEQSWPEDCVFLLLCSLWVGSLLYAIPSNLSEYRGLSGVLYGYTLFYGLKSYAHQRLFAIAVIIFITARLLWQQSNYFDETATIEQLGGVISVDAHKYGYIGGLLGFIGSKLRNRV